MGHWRISGQCLMILRGVIRPVQENRKRALSSQTNNSVTRKTQWFADDCLLRYVGNNHWTNSLRKMLKIIWRFPPYLDFLIYPFSLSKTSKKFPARWALLVMNGAMAPINGLIKYFSLSFHPYKWIYVTNLTTGFWSHFAVVCFWNYLTPSLKKTNIFPSSLLQLAPVCSGACGVGSRNMWSQVGRGSAALLGQRGFAVPVAVSLRKSRGEVWLLCCCEVGFFNRWEAGGMVQNMQGRWCCSNA